jgi:hypothetical protein
VIYVPVYNISLSMKKISIKQKLLNTIAAHPKLFALSIGLALTMAVGTATGMLDHSHSAQAVFYPERP